MFKINNSFYKLVLELCVALLFLISILFLIKKNSVFFVKFSKLDVVNNVLQVELKQRIVSDHVCVNEYVFIQLLLKFMQNKPFNKEIEYLISLNNNKKLDSFFLDLYEYSNGLLLQTNKVKCVIFNKILTINKISTQYWEHQNLKEKIVQNIELLAQEFIFNQNY